LRQQLHDAWRRVEMGKTQVAVQRGQFEYRWFEMDS
jgi:hypothetical protein